MEQRNWFTREPEVFADHFEPLIKLNKIVSEANNQYVNIKSYEKRYVFFPNFEEKFDVWKKILIDFNNSPVNNSENALICFIDQNKDFNQHITLLQKIYSRENLKCNLIAYSGKGGTVDEEKLIALANYYITTRSNWTVRRTCMADSYGVKVVAGTDVPILFCKYKKILNEE